MNWRRDEVIVRFAGICGVLGKLGLELERQEDTVERIERPAAN